MAQKTLTTSYLAQLTNANHDGVTQQIYDRLQGFETDNTMLQQAAAAVHTARQAEDAAYDILNALAVLQPTQELDALGELANSYISQFPKES
jgi:hypothetical protein